jgi:hypothetical protein
MTSAWQTGHRLPSCGATSTSRTDHTASRGSQVRARPPPAGRRPHNDVSGRRPSAVDSTTRWRRHHHGRALRQQPQRRARAAAGSSLRRPEPRPPHPPERRPAPAGQVRWRRGDGSGLGFVGLAPNGLILACFAGFCFGHGRRFSILSSARRDLRCQRLIAPVRREESATHKMQAGRLTWIALGSGCIISETIGSHGKLLLSHSGQAPPGLLSQGGHDLSSDRLKMACHFGQVECQHANASRRHREADKNEGFPGRRRQSKVRRASAPHRPGAHRAAPPGVIAVRRARAIRSSRAGIPHGGRGSRVALSRARFARVSGRAGIVGSVVKSAALGDTIRGSVAARPCRRGRRRTPGRW